MKPGNLPATRFPQAFMHLALTTARFRGVMRVGARPERLPWDCGKTEPNPNGFETVPCLSVAATPLGLTGLAGLFPG